MAGTFVENYCLGEWTLRHTLFYYVFNTYVPEIHIGHIRYIENILDSSRLSNYEPDALCSFLLRLRSNIIIC